MAMERRNPLPVGRYWVDMPTGETTDKFVAWMSKNKAAIGENSNSLREGTHGVPGVPDSPDLNVFFFVVKAPVKWEGPGYPTIAQSWQTSAQDTVQEPPPEKNPLDKLADTMGSLGGVGSTVTKVAMGVVVVGVLALVGWLGISSFAKARARSAADE